MIKPKPVRTDITKTSLKIIKESEFDLVQSAKLSKYGMKVEKGKLKTVDKI